MVTSNKTAGKKTSIGLSSETYQRIAGHGKFGDSMEDILIRLLDFYESRSKLLREEKLAQTARS